MSKDIREILHLYLGCDMIYTNKGPIPGERFVLTSGNLMWAESCIKDGSLKPILRKLSSMTEEEKRELLPERTESVDGITVVTTYESFRLLLSKGFDLFNLIPRGLALDSDSKQ
jgi:hypothetical protein